MQKLKHGRESLDFEQRFVSTKAELGDAKLFPCSFLYRIWVRCVGRYLHSFLSHSSRLLGLFWLVRRSAQESNSGHQGNRYLLASRLDDNHSSLFSSDIQISDSLERRATWDKEWRTSLSAKSDFRTNLSNGSIKLKDTRKRIMPVVALKPANKMGFGFAYPPSGKIKIYLEASYPVDVFLASNDQATKINSPTDAVTLGAHVFTQQMLMPHIEIGIPPSWSSGWQLVVGNPHPSEVVAVFYQIYQA